jgi:uncharacterized protein (TIGR02145 family)
MKNITLLTITLCGLAICQTNTFTDSRDGQKYRIVKIENQTWMAKNLNYNADNSKCYRDSITNCEKYGRLYDWKTAMKACPSGWHLPSKAEWEELSDSIGGSSVEGMFLKAKSGWNNNGNGIDLYGFAALPGGYGFSGGDLGIGSYGSWWTASEVNDNVAYYRYMYGNLESARWDRLGKGRLRSIRCMQSQENEGAKDEALAINGNLAEALNNRGIAHFYNGDYDRAIEDYNSALKIKPDYAEALNNRGVAYSNKGNHDRAIEDYNSALKIKPDDAKTFLNRGVAYDDKGNHDRAIEDYSSALKIKPDYVGALYNRGLAYGLKGELNRAIADWEAVLRLDPNNANAKENIETARQHF